VRIRRRPLVTMAIVTHLVTRPLLIVVLDLSNRCGRVDEVRLSDELAGRQRGCLGSEEPAIQAGDPHDLDQSRAG
jgi:hypothetical protein